MMHRELSSFPMLRASIMCSFPSSPTSNQAPAPAPPILLPLPGLVGLANPGFSPAPALAAGVEGSGVVVPLSGAAELEPPPPPPNSRRMYSSVISEGSEVSICSGVVGVVGGASVPKHKTERREHDYGPSSPLRVLGLLLEGRSPR